jgi:hypothetical protein
VLSYAIHPTLAEGENTGGLTLSAAKAEPAQSIAAAVPQKSLTESSLTARPHIRHQGHSTAKRSPARTSAYRQNETFGQFEQMSGNDLTGTKPMEMPG